MKVKRYGFALLLFGMLILIVFFAIDSILAFPGVVNSTAFNVTSDADLNLSGKCQPNCAHYVDGKIIGGAGNRSNLTAWETFSDNELLNNPTWTLFNMSNFPYANNMVSARADQGFLNLTTRTDDTSGTIWISVMRKIEISIPPSGIIVDFWVKPIGAAGNTWHPIFCFDFTYGNVANGTTFLECNMPASGAGVMAFYYESATNEYKLQRMEGGSMTTVTTIGKRSGREWEHWTVWVNQTHFAAAVNLTEGGGESTAIVSHGITTTPTGAASFDIYHGIIDDYRSALYDNISISNATQFGQPFNFTPAVMETIILNSTITATNVKVTNQTYYYANNSAAIFQVFDRYYGNTKSIQEGANNAINGISGIGFNATLIPPSLFVASEFTNFLLQWNGSDAFPSLQQNFSNITTFRKGNIIRFGFNLSDDLGLSFLYVEHNMTIDGVVTNITIPLSGTDFDASANLTMLFGNTTNFYIKPYFNDSANQMNNTIPRAFYTTSNTASTVPTISTPTEGSFRTTSTVTWAAVGDVDNNTATYRVYVNSTFNGSTTATSLTLNMTTERTYAVNVSAFDGTDDSGNSSTIQFVFDNLAPRIDNGSNSDNTTKLVNRNWAFLNFTFTEPFNYTTYILNSSGVTTTNTTPTMSSGYFYYNFTNLSDGNYVFRGWMNDSARNASQTSNITITVDVTPPSFTGNISNQTSVTVNVANVFEINITDTVSNLTSVIAEFEDVNAQKENLTLSNSSLNSAGQNIRFNGSYTPNVAGTWYLKFYAEDFAGNVNRTPDRFMQFTVNAAGNGGGSGGGGGGGGGSSDGCAANYANVNNTCVPVGNLTKAERCGDSFCDALLGEDPFNCLKDCPYQAASFTCSDPTKPCLFNNQSFVATIVIGIFALGVIFLQLQIRSVDDAKDKFRQLRNKLKSTVFRRKF